VTLELKSKPVTLSPTLKHPKNLEMKKKIQKSYIKTHLVKLACFVNKNTFTKAAQLTKMITLGILNCDIINILGLTFLNS
jgi:hypothetical protein